MNGSPDLGLTEAELPLLGEHDLDAVHCRILTSGTSGGPRPVGLTYGNHLWSAVGSAFNLCVEPTDRWLCCLPLFHIGGLSIVMRSVIYGTLDGPPVMPDWGALGMLLLVSIGLLAVATVIFKRLEQSFAKVR